jgi:hypothetical protein
MVRALGYSHSSFDPCNPGRLCRGRERWVDAYPLDDRPELYRLVISGATLSDDSARDARRGLVFSGLSTGDVAHALFPGATFVAMAEDAHPREIPDQADGVEHYDLRQSGGPLHQWAVRWSLICQDEADIDDATEAGAECILVLPELPDEAPGHSVTQEVPLADDPIERGPGLPKSLQGGLHLLLGHRTEGPPSRHFQATALPDLLTQAIAVILVHQDKHAGCIGVYLNAIPEDLDGVLQRACDGVGALSVPFAIPPMLARWDRALWELRQKWDPEINGDYPVPPAQDVHYGWSRRRRGARLRGGEEE